MIKAQIEGGKEFQVELSGQKGSVDGEEFTLDLREGGSPHEIHVVYKNQSHNIVFLETDVAAKKVSLVIDGEVYKVQLSDKYDELLKALGMEKSSSSKMKTLKAPMPGLVLDVAVGVGQEVEANETLVILEAMKMENVIKSPAGGIVSSVSVNKGQTVEKNEILLEFE